MNFVGKIETNMSDTRQIGPSKAQDSCNRRLWRRGRGYRPLVPETDARESIRQRSWRKFRIYSMTYIELQHSLGLYRNNEGEHNLTLLFSFITLTILQHYNWEGKKENIFLFMGNGDYFLTAFIVFVCFFSKYPKTTKLWSHPWLM